MKKDTILGGIIGLIIGFIVLVLGVNAMAKPSNEALSFNPVEAISTLYFSGTYPGGIIGGIIVTLLLLAFAAICYFIGSFIHGKIITK